MKCHICDSEDDTITLDKKDGRFCPCRTCQAIIYDTIISYEIDEVEEDTLLDAHEHFDEGPKYSKGRVT